MEPKGIVDLHGAYSINDIHDQIYVKSIIDISRIEISQMHLDLWI